MTEEVREVSEFTELLLKHPELWEKVENVLKGVPVVPALSTR